MVSVTLQLLHLSVGTALGDLPTKKNCSLSRVRQVLFVQEKLFQYGIISKPP